jgi:hypothetical protein
MVLHSSPGGPETSAEKTQDPHRSTQLKVDHQMSSDNPEPDLHTDVYRLSKNKVTAQMYNTNPLDDLNKGEEIIEAEE